MDDSLPPVPDIVRSAYATLIVTSLAEARRFWVDLLGFVVTDSDAEALYLRGYDELTHHNLILRSGPVAAAGPLGFRVRSDADLAKAEAYYAALGCRSERLPAGAVRGLGEVVRVEDPLGFLVDFFASAAHPERLQQRYDLRRGAEVARLDHFNICVPDVPRAYAYYSSLGFGLSETIEDGQTLYAAWMYRKQTVHDVAFTGGAGPRLHHLGFFAHEPHSVLRMCDILGSLSLESCIERGPGAARGLQRVLRLPARPRRAPAGDLHLRLLHRRPGPPGAALVGARPPAARLLGERGHPVLVLRRVGGA